MEKILFASDLDNTLMFSHKYRGETDQCVEWLDGREQGFCTRRSLELLALVGQRTLFVPVTSRSVEQYRRIRWPSPCLPRYAVTSNGGVLLEGDREDLAWRAGSEELTAPWREELAELEARLGEVPIPKRFRMVDGLYLFAACDDQESARQLGDLFEGRTTVDVAVSGRKVYFFPPPLNKGEALRRLQERFQPDRTVCAGDSVIDVPMLRAADRAIVPGEDLMEEGPNRLVHSGAGPFPDFVLESVLNFTRSGGYGDVQAAGGGWGSIPVGDAGDPGRK